MEFSPRRFGQLLLVLAVLVAVAGLAMMPWAAWGRERSANALLSSGMVTSGTVVEVRHQPGGGRGARYSFLDESGRRIEGWLATPGFSPPSGATVTTIDAKSAFPAEGSVLTVAYRAGSPHDHAAWSAEAPASGAGSAGMMPAIAVLATAVFLACAGVSLVFRRPRGPATG